MGFSSRRDFLSPPFPRPPPGCWFLCSKRPEDKLRVTTFTFIYDFLHVAHFFAFSLFFFFKHMVRLSRSFAESHYFHAEVAKERPRKERHCVIMSLKRRHENHTLEITDRSSLTLQSFPFCYFLLCRGMEVPGLYGGGAPRFPKPPGKPNYSTVVELPESQTRPWHSATATQDNRKGAPAVHVKGSLRLGSH